MNLLTFVLIEAIILSPSSVLRIVVGIPFVLFFPGYALTAALFPRRVGMSGIERVALSFCLGIAMVAIIRLILNYTRFGIRLESILTLWLLCIFVTSIIAWLRRKRLVDEERFGFHLALPSWGVDTRDKALSISGAHYIGCVGDDWLCYSYA